MNYKGIAEPPRNMALWENLIREFTLHMVERHSLDEVVQWKFEVMKIQAFVSKAILLQYDASLICVK